MQWGTAAILCVAAIPALVGSAAVACLAHFHHLTRQERDSISGSEQAGSAQRLKLGRSA